MSATNLSSITPPGAAILRAYCASDRELLGRLDANVIDWWHAKGQAASLHLVAALRDSGAVVAHLQAMDAGYPAPSRRTGQCQFTLRVAPEHRRKGIGSALTHQVEAFSRRRRLCMLYTSYIDCEGAPARAFLTNRGFALLETFHPSYLDLAGFDPAPFAAVIERVERCGICLTTYAAVGDTPDHRRRLYELEQAARATQPFREVAPYVPEPFPEWEEAFAKRDPATMFLAVSTQPKVFVGIVTGLEWYFTGVHSDWRGRGIATALKLRCIVEAKRRGVHRMETENHGDNLAMIAVNRKLGFVFTDQEIACVKRLEVPD